MNNQQGGMTKRSWGISLFKLFAIAPWCLIILSTTEGVRARPASVFIPHLEEIQGKLPAGLPMRLPAEIRIGQPLDIDESRLIIRVFPSETPLSFIVSLFTCSRGSFPCFLGSFTATSQTNVSAQRELQKYKEKGDRITLAPNVEGYLLEGPQQNPSYPFSAVMWQQNHIIYTINFPAIERQNILFMAVSMAQQQPLYPRAPIP
ncbi:MAG TPA: hypothetical protein DEP38_20415 [Cyanobacteria bacterium UBA9226]|nr:hypothetical protein [Cyanobacteria bacterium UBA9226]